MKKKIVFCLLLFCLFLTGCGNNNSKNVINNLTKKINGLKSYTIEGNLEIINNDDVFNYYVSSNYKSKDKYKVVLKNISNNHEQIILKNDDGVYVVTPSLNKSFKFQSEWPENNSQIYILKNIIEDINNDNNAKVSENGDYYIIESNVNYPNNANLVKQRIMVDENLMIKSVEVLDNNDNKLMIFTVDKLNYKPIFDESFFEINSIINSSDNAPLESTSTLDDIIYPLYIPTGTVLSKEEKVSKENGDRIILTFSGDKAFTLIEETVNVEEEFTVIPTFGEPYMLIDTVGSLSNNSINWVSNGIEYYIVSDVMNQTELIKVAESITTKNSMK